MFNSKQTFRTSDVDRESSVHGRITINGKKIKSSVCWFRRKDYHYNKADRYSQVCFELNIFYCSKKYKCKVKG
jgi:hypothetical protein